MKKIAVILCVAMLVAVLAGCSGGTTENQENTKKPGAELIGQWRSQGGGVRITFNQDGTLKEENVGNWVQTALWSVEGDELTVDFSDRGGEKEIYTYSVKDNALYIENEYNAMKLYR